MNSFLKFMDVVSRLTKYVLILIITIMSVLVFIQVPGRYLLGDTPPYLSEIATYCLIWTAFLGSSLAFQGEKHVAISFFIDKLSSPQKVRFVSIISNLCVLAFLIIFLLGSSQYAASMSQQTSATMGFSMLWPALGAPIGAVLMILQVLRNMTRLRGE